ncbi:MAG: hypothetical protein G01um10148_127 [Parcubacteria group bacterium Gr01-1014_8]|nr:MAG: hypothetical protein G01um10148_127 [Parcubacteria group bacterium Gr01-1014_8]
MGYTVRMLSLFPELLFLAPFSALVIRVAVAVIFAFSAWTRMQSEQTLLKVFGAIDAILAVMFLSGGYTQLAALIGAVCAIAWLSRTSIRPLPVSTVWLALIMCISLLVTGAGPFAFDLPL